MEPQFPDEPLLTDMLTQRHLVAQYFNGSLVFVMVFFFFLTFMCVFYDFLWNPKQCSTQPWLNNTGIKGISKTRKERQKNLEQHVSWLRL